MGSILQTYTARINNSVVQQLNGLPACVLIKNNTASNQLNTSILDKFKKQIHVSAKVHSHHQAALKRK